MVEIDTFTLPAFKYLAAESENICRLCFSATDASDSGVSLDECRLIQCQYYDDTISYSDMLTELGVSSEPALPQMLCEYCADTTISSFLFQKLCQQSHNIWKKIIEKFEKTISLTNILSPTVKSAYLIVNNEDNQILTSRKLQVKKSKEYALGRIQNLMKEKKSKRTQHLKTTKQQKTKRKYLLICEECGREFKTKHYLKNHIMRSHSKTKYSCKHCPKLFPSKAQLHAHSERIHDPKTISCPKCPTMVSSEKMLKFHDSLYHVTAVCKECSIRFPSKAALQQHSDLHKIKECPRCKIVIKSKNSFRYHLKKCGMENQLNFYCDICNKGYARKNGLVSHIKTRHGVGPVYCCDWCNKPFCSVSRLRNHTVKHTRERNFHCDMCGGKFVTQPALTSHLRIHTGEKPFPCDLCEESFRSASRRMEHKRRKHWGPSKECPFCHNKFVTSHELHKHVVRHKNPQSRLYVATSIE